MAPHTATEVDIHQLFNTKVYDRNGEEFAKVANVWVDDNAHPYFLGIQTHGSANHVIPAQGAELSSRGNKVRLAYDKATVEASPTCDPREDLRDEDERKIYTFFQDKGPDLTASYTAREQSDVGRAEEKSIPREEKSIPLKEEEMVVGKRDVEEGSVRLRKVVRSKTEEQPVELRSEELVVEREPGSGEKVSPETLGEEEYYIPLYHEEAVVQKQAREKERVHVGKRETTEREVVSEKLREEELKGPERQS
ncbi:DUF2382 domain-containing protein [Nitrosococcus wardiae]|nr:PRC and DUF2382 domain-containing protein [Nitrosococcus wardiae]